MSITRRRLSSSFPGDREIPLRPVNHKPAAAMVVVFGTAVFAALIAVSAKGNPGFQLVMGSCALFISAFGVMLPILRDAVAEWTLHLDTRAPQLRFAPPTKLSAIFLIAAGLAMLPALVGLVFEIRGEPVAVSWTGRAGIYGIGLLAVLWLGQQLWSLRLPPGLTLSPRGLTGVRGAKPVDIPWSELAAVSTVSGRGAKLVLRRTGGDTTLIEPLWIGSDPRVVTAIIDYYLTHPAQRSLLDDPRSAIHAVEAAAVRDPSPD